MPLAYVCTGDHANHKPAFHCTCGAGYYAYVLRWAQGACPNCGDPWGSDEAADAAAGFFKLATGGMAVVDATLVLEAARMLNPDVLIWTPRSNAPQILTAAYKSRQLLAAGGGRGRHYCLYAEAKD